jgi:phosphate transport system permease protein
VTILERHVDSGPPAPTGPGSGPSGGGPSRPARLSVRRRPTDLALADYVTGAASAASASAITWVAVARLTDGVGWFPFVVIAYVVFVVLFTLVTTDRLGWLTAKSRMATTLVGTGAFVILIPLVWLVGYIFVRGIQALRVTFLVNDLTGVAATDAATAGGGAHAIVGTIEQVTLALIVTVPLAISCAIFLNETTSRLRRPVRIFVDAMSGLPSVVAGLFIFAVLIVPFGDTITLFGYNGFMASLALSMVMMPTITRTVEVVLRLVPGGLREAGLALGASRARVVWSVVLPTARSGLTTAIVLGIARAVGETAPLLFTSFNNRFFTTSVTQPISSLTVQVFTYAISPYEDWHRQAWAGALVLVSIVLICSLLARLATRRLEGMVRQ